MILDKIVEDKKSNIFSKSLDRLSKNEESLKASFVLSPNSLRENAILVIAFSSSEDLLAFFKLPLLLFWILLGCLFLFVPLNNDPIVSPANETFDFMVSNIGFI